MLSLPLTVFFIIRYYCAFHVQEYTLNSVAETKTLINAALTSKFKNDSITIETMDVVIKHIGKLDSLTQMQREICAK